MKMIACERGHFFDPAQSPTCPVCRQRKPKLRSTGDPAAMPGPAEPPIAPASRAETIGVMQRELGIDPVVGWLVCVEGADRGRDYRIRSERNTIGLWAAFGSQETLIHGNTLRDNCQEARSSVSPSREPSFPTRTLSLQTSPPETWTRLPPTTC